MRDFLIVNGKNLKDFGVYAFGNGIHKFPERAVEKISIPGRTGDLLIDRGKWENIDVEYSMALLDGANIDRLRAFLLSLRGYVRIESTFEPDVYRLGRFVGASDPKVHREAATVTLTFDCKPQRWLKSGDKAVPLTPYTETGTYNDKVYNPTHFNSLPLIKVTKRNTSTVSDITRVIEFFDVIEKQSTYFSDTTTVGRCLIYLLAGIPNDAEVVIDCESKTATIGGVNVLGDNKVVLLENDYPYTTTTEFPYMIASEYEGYKAHTIVRHTSLHYDSGDIYEDIELQPRWWTI